MVSIGELQLWVVRLRVAVAEKVGKGDDLREAALLRHFSSRRLVDEGILGSLVG